MECNAACDTSRVILKIVLGPLFNVNVIIVVLIIKLFAVKSRIILLCMLQGDGGGFSGGKARGRINEQRGERVRSRREAPGERTARERVVLDVAEESSVVRGGQHTRRDSRRENDDKAVAGVKHDQSS